MQTIPKSKANPAHVIVHRRLQHQFNKHRAKFDKHRSRGSAFAAALAEFEHKLFGSKSDS
jgi:hypothetical protein